MRRRRWSSFTLAVMALGVGSGVGALVGLWLFGFPPVYLSPDGDDRSACSVIGERAGAILAAELQPEVERVFPTAWDAVGGSGTTTTPELTGVRCGDGLRAWGTPIRTQARERWVDALGTSLVELGFEVPDAEPLASVSAGAEPPAASHRAPTVAENGALPVSGDAGDEPELRALREEVTDVAAQRDAAVERLRAATAPGVLTVLEEGDPEEVADLRRNLVDAYAALSAAQARLGELESELAAAEAAAGAGEQPNGGNDPADGQSETSRDDPSTEDDPTSDTGPQDGGDGSPSDDLGASAPLHRPPPDRFAIEVPTAVVPMTLGGVLGGLVSLLLAIVVLLATAARRRQATPPAHRPRDGVSLRMQHGPPR